METVSPLLPSRHTEHDAKTHDELLMQHSLLFSDSLKELKNLRSQLYKAAEFFELSYINESHNQFVIRTLKDYSNKALVNTVDHLGSLSFKVIDLLDEKVDEVSRTEFHVSFIEQRIRTCRELVHQEILSQQSLMIVSPKYHKQYILPVGEFMPHSGRHATPKFEVTKSCKDNIESQPVPTMIRDKQLSPSKMCSMLHAPSSQACFLSPAQLRGMFLNADRTATSPLLTSNPRSRSFSYGLSPLNLHQCACILKGASRTLKKTQARAKDLSSLCLISTRIDDNSHRDLDEH